MRGSWQDYLELTKPRLSLLVLVTTLAGFWLGLRALPRAWYALPALLATALVVGGANALNQWIERGPDALMRRTSGRPLPSGRLSPRAACRFGWGLSLAGLAGLAFGVNPLAAALALAGWVSYVLVYTPLKRVSPLCTLVGAIPGALPPVIGWAAARGALGPGAWALFAILYVWQLPHFLSLAILYRDDYARAGFRMLPVTEPGAVTTARQMVLYGLTLLPISLLPAWLGLTGIASFFGALALSLAFLAIAARTAWLRSPRSARQLFLASVVYLPTLLILLVCDRRAL